MTLQDNLLLKTVGQLADQLDVEIYAVGGFVRDYLLQRAGRRGEVDFVVVGDGIAFAQALAQHLRLPKPVIYPNFGTAMLKWNEHQLEFVGARKESYRSDSRKPEVEAADLATDLARRDFTINAMALGLRRAEFGRLIDPFDGQKDLRAHLIRTPLEPATTFNDDPLRIMRAIRFAVQLQFEIEPETFVAAQKMRERLLIISQERTTDELLKIVAAPKPS